MPSTCTRACAVFAYMGIYLQESHASGLLQYRTMTISLNVLDDTTLAHIVLDVIKFTTRHFCFRVRLLVATVESSCST
jgi:hypothetical protein